MKALTTATLRNGRRIAGQVQRVAAEHLKPPRGPGDWLAGAALGAAGLLVAEVVGDDAVGAALLHAAGRGGGEKGDDHEGALHNQSFRCGV